MADLNDYQNYMREQRRQADKNIVNQVGSIRSRSALYEFALSVALPNVMSDLDSSKLYAVAKMTDPDVWQDFLTSEGSEEHLMAISVVSKRGMEWCGQLLQLEWGWSMQAAFRCAPLCSAVLLSVAARAPRPPRRLVWPAGGRAPDVSRKCPGSV